MECWDFSFRPADWEICANFVGNLWNQVHCALGRTRSRRIFLANADNSIAARSFMRCEIVNVYAGTKRCV